MMLKIMTQDKLNQIVKKLIKKSLKNLKHFNKSVDEIIENFFCFICSKIAIV